VEFTPTTLRQRRIVDQASACLPYLEGCAQQNRNSQLLLRATADDSKAICSARLLRAL